MATLTQDEIYQILTDHASIYSGKDESSCAFCGERLFGESPREIRRHQARVIAVTLLNAEADSP